MEFPETGKQCSVNNCSQLDFLPVNCNHCLLTFCKEHFSAIAHTCSKLVDNIVDETKEAPAYKCSKPDCENKTPVEIICSKCKIHFCISHRHHGCFDTTEEEKSNKLEEYKKPDNQFSEAKRIVDKEVATKLGKSKNNTALKVRLMKLKLKSIGLASIPTTDRCYFSVYCPKTNSVVTFDKPKEIFVSNDWSIGKVIDSMSELLKIPNYNNQPNKAKLRLFHHSNGNIVTNTMDTVLSDLLNNNTLINGQDIILEYSDSDKVDSTLYT